MLRAKGDCPVRVSSRPLVWPPNCRPVAFPFVQPGQTTLAVQHYLEQLTKVQGSAPAEPIIRALLARAVDRLHLLCAGMLHRNYPRLTRGPVNLNSEEMLGAVVARLIQAMQKVRPQTVRQFFALASQHMRWELNELARQLDERTRGCHFRNRTWLFLIPSSLLQPAV